MRELDSKSGEGRLPHAVWLLVLQALGSLWCCWLMYLAPLSTARCEDLCDYSTITVAINSFFVIALLTFVGSLVGVVLLRSRGWWVIAPPVISIAAVTAAWVVATNVANRAMLL